MIMNIYQFFNYHIERIVSNEKAFIEIAYDDNGSFVEKYKSIFDSKCKNIMVEKVKNDYDLLELSKISFDVTFILSSHTIMFETRYDSEFISALLEYYPESFI